MKDLLLYIARNLVDDPDAVSVTEVPGDDVRTVDVTVRRLREKIEVDPANPVFILTRRGAGYYFAV